MRNKLPILFAALALAVASLACSVLGGGEPSLSNVRTAYDSDGENTSSTFGSFDTVYVVTDLENGVSGNVVSSNWYGENVDGFDPDSFIDIVEYTVVDETFTGTVHFYFEAPSSGWPLGTYRVEVFFNGAPAGTVRFTIQ
ncbi:MAG: hypothetical protein DCC56_11135 [Anaerolineae bacterium]|nr:hypothetical protein [Anaerolineales bacterium]RIK29923.1 MAG: hypothetical protein DCC56_11135 [Anaerolineae bacterium]WKZ45737.1 MAG: hypothetical protein QY302_08080 [Anaerolineales bacterium]